MRTRWVSFVVAASAVVLACKPAVEVKPGLVVKGKRLEAKFDRPMVAAEALGRDLTEAPLRVRPEAPGRFRWLDARTLAFLPSGPLPRSTRFEVEVPAGTKALDGFGITEPARWSFETERLRLTFPSSGLSPPERWATPDQSVLLGFNQPVRADDVEKHCAFTSAGGTDTIASKVGADAAGPRPEKGEQMRVFPRDPLALATRWRFRCETALTGAEGPLGLEAPGGASASASAGASVDAGRPPNEIAFETYGPFTVKSVTPAGSDISPDDVSLVITLSNPLPQTSGDKNALPITVTPAIDGFPERASAFGERVMMNVRALRPNTRYTIEIAGTLVDRFGQKLPEARKASFTTGEAAPRLDVETGAWVVESSRPGYVGWGRNLTRIEAEVAAVPEAKLAAVAARLDWWDEQTVDLAKVGLRGTRTTIAVEGKRNEWGQVSIEPARLLGKAGPATGFYYVVLRAPEEPATAGQAGETRPARELLLNFTDLGVTAKLAGPSGLVWVTRLSDGQPQAGAEVSIRDGKGKVRWRGTTGPDGVAVTPGRAQLLPKAKTPAPAPEGEGEGEWGGEGMDFTGARATELLVFARAGADVTWVNPERSGGLSSWNFHVTATQSARAEQLRGFLHSDRGLYRPGDTVHLRGLGRTLKLGGPLRVPAARKARVTVRDPRGEEVLARSVPLSRYGGFAVDVPLSDGARLGDYQVEAALPDGSFHERFSVEQYRPAAFEVKVPPPGREPVAGEELRLSAEARYLYGAPLRGGALTWRVHRRDRSVSFHKLPSYEFGDTRALYDSADARSREAEPLLTEEEERLDKDGRAQLVVKLPKQSAGGALASPAYDLMVTAEVQDETHQTIAANIAIPAHPAAVYFGIDPGSPVAEAKAARKLALVAVDPKGARIAAQGTLRVIKRDWNCAYEAWGYSGSYRCEKKESQVMKQAVAVAAGAPAEVRFTPPSPGQYLVVVEGADAAGNLTATSTSLWVWGAGEAAWQADESERFEIVADKPRYNVGDTARLLLKTTVRDAKGLLTVERDGVLERRLVDVGAGASTVEVPIKEGYGPNVYASVMLVKGRTGKGPRGLPVMRMGMVTLPVDVESKRLRVAVTTDRESYRPGDTVSAELRVTDADGKPVAAEVALSAADEGVLTLIAFKTPDPVATFYAPWALGVTTATQYERLARLPEPDETRYATGGDGGAPGTLRSRFLATAYWNPAVETDAATGTAKVTFQAPDNLTAYRLMAVAADAGERFGSGERRITVRKPLQLLGAMPRFLSVGDDAKGGVLVVNDTGKAGSAVIDATVTGARLAGGAHQEIALAAGGRAAVVFPLRADRAGEVRLRVRASLGDAQDGLELRIPARDPAPVETELVAQGSTTPAAGPATLAVKLPAGVIPGSASLELSTDPDGVAGLEEGLRDLIEYPYGCLEQTTSRLIPLVAVEELARSLALAKLDGPALQRFIRAGLEKIERFQTEEGGFSLWEGGKPEPYLTAFALWGLKLAGDAGHKTRKAVTERGVRWLHGALGREPAPGDHVHNELGEMGGRAFAVHVLGLLDRPEPGYATKLLENKQALPRFGTAFLARALAMNLGAQHPSVIALLDDLARAARPKGVGSSIIPEPPGHDLGWYMSNDVRTTAIATDAFLDLRPSEPLLPELVKALFDERRKGRWETTQDNLYALVALTHYVKSRSAGKVSVEAALAGKPVLSGDLAGKALRIRRVSVPLDAAHPPAGPLTIAATGGEVFYSALLRYRRRIDAQKPHEHEMSVRREYLDPASGAPVDPGKGIAVGGMVRVRVTVSSPAFRAHLAVDDPIPAGLEPVNTKLVTSSAPPGPARPGRRGGGDGDDLEEAWWRPSWRELRDDRVLVFIDQLPPGPASFEYLARATTAGKFIVPGVSAEEMYRPEVSARAAPLTFVVRAK